MPMRYKRFLKETETFSISKIGKKQNKFDSIDGDSLTPSELIAQIDTNLRHLKGQKKILQNVRDGKTWRNKWSLNEKTDKKNLESGMSKHKSRCCGQIINDILPKVIENKIVKVTDSYTLIGSSLNNLNLKKRRSPSREDKNIHLPCDEPSFNAEMKIYKYRSSVKESSKTQNNLPNKYSKSHQLSPRIETDTNLKLIPKLRTASERNLERTESSIRRHAKLSKEILDFAKRRGNRFTSQKSSEDKTHKEISSAVYNRSLQSPNKILSKKIPDVRERYDKKEHRKSDDEVSGSKNNNLTETSWSSKSHNVNTIKPKVIDDSTYICPDNSEENDYSILPYVGNTSEDKVYFNLSLKPERKGVSSQQSSKPSRSIGNGTKSKTYKSDHAKEGFSPNAVNEKCNREKSLIQSSDKYEYKSHNLESTWESHTNFEGPLSLKFDTSHRNHIKILTNNYQSHCYEHKDHSVQSFSKRFSQKKNEIKLLPSSIYGNAVHKKARQMEQSKRPMHLLQKQSVNEAFPSSESILDTPEERFSTESVLKNGLKNDQAFIIETDTTNLKDNSPSTLSLMQPEKLGNPIDLELYESLSELGYINSDISEKTSIVKQKEKHIQNLEKNAFKTPPLQLLTKRAPLLGAISKRTKETPKLISPRTIKAPVKDTKQDNILIKDNFETTASSKETSSIVSWTPRNKSKPTSQKSASQANQSVTSKFESNCTQNDLKSITKIECFSLTGLPTKCEIQDISRKSSQKINTSTGDTSLTHQPEPTSNEITSKANPAFNLKLGSNQDADVGVLTSFPSILSLSKLDSTAKVSGKRNDFYFKSKTYESQDNSDNSQKPPKNELKIYTPPGGTSLQFEPDHTSKVNQSDEKKKPKLKHIANIEVSFPFPTILNDSELGANPKLNANEKNLTFKSITKKTSLSLSDLPKIYKTSDFHQKSSHSYPELNNSIGRMLSNFETLSKKETNNKSDEKVNTSSLLNQYKMKENDSSSISSDVKEPESPTTCKQIFSQQSLPKTNKTSAGQYLELFCNNKDAVKNIFRTSTSKFKQKSNLSRSSKSSYDLNNNKPIKILQCTTSEKSNIKWQEKQIKKVDNFKPEKPDSNMSLQFLRPDEGSPSISLKSNLSNNPTKNKLDKHFDQNSSLTLYSSNETKGSLKNGEINFLSDTFKQNITVEGVSREASDLIQHLQNRVKDCDEKVKSQSRELEKIKTNCKTFEPLTYIEYNIKEHEENKSKKDLKEPEAKELLENFGINELMEPLNRKDAQENDLKEENSCRCLFCVLEKSTSDYSEEIPLFTGCECMKEDYFKIMRIAYDK